MFLSHFAHVIVCMCAGGFKDDEDSGMKLYGYTMDSCADPNFWCQNDPGHLDLSSAYLDGLGMIGEHMNARKATWKYMDGAAPGCVLFVVSCKLFGSQPGSQTAGSFSSFPELIAGPCHEESGKHLAVRCSLHDVLQHNLLL